MAEKTLFPVWEVPQVQTPAAATERKYRRSVSFDFEAGDFARDGSGNMVEADGREAYIQWCLKACDTERFTCLAYSADIGTETIEALAQPTRQAVESAIERMGIAPVLARNGSDSWLFHKGSSEIRIFVYDGDYLFSTSPINLLPKKNVEPVLDYMLSEDFGPYKLGIEGRQIYIAYRIHLSDITPESEDTIRDRIVGLALRADEMDNMLIERFGCEFSEYSKAEA